MHWSIRPFCGDEFCLHRATRVLEIVVQEETAHMAAGGARVALVGESILVP